MFTSTLNCYNNKLAEVMQPFKEKPANLKEKAVLNFWTKNLVLNHQSVCVITRIILKLRWQEATWS